MASRATGYWRSMLTRVGGSRPFATSTRLKMAQTTGNSAQASHSYNKFSATGEFAPVYVVLGMLMIALSIGAHTAKQQIAHCPNVCVTKKKRGSISEVEEPDHVVTTADKFVNKSFLRKVAHIQDHNRTIPDPVRPDPFARFLIFICSVSNSFTTKLFKFENSNGGLIFCWELPDHEKRRR
ncbi:NADH-ubiquinone reductase complex 1 MLRQ subunit [Melia azedarach]|uniref:NADH-ubiquinone reductase complex 1 MLRQ subunit n=1 Tax=Melia azedarach TaxID=155640 RepID=A0ACC1YAU9_MELAZ|nr:NADH-ubiquinone reductase complex 1 MLRQ subunit [Melia azedarach]